MSMFKRVTNRFVNAADPVAVDEFYKNFRPTIPLDRAMLCLDCENLFEAEGSQTCPGCGSNSAWSLSRALNRIKGVSTCS